VKAFLPVLLIVICASLIFFIMPSRVDGRIGLGITALLTLVALQLTASSSLPEVGYLMLIDKIYLASYAFIIAALGRVVATSWSGEDGRSVEEVARHDHMWAGILLSRYAGAIARSARGTFKTLWASDNGRNPGREPTHAAALLGRVYVRQRGWSTSNPAIARYAGRLAGTNAGGRGAGTSAARFRILPLAQLPSDMVGLQRGLASA
jgi:hypothetical protein